MGQKTHNAAPYKASSHRKIEMQKDPGMVQAWVGQNTRNAATYNRLSIFFSLSDLSYVGFVPVGDLLDIKGDKKTFQFCCKNKSQNIDFFVRKNVRRFIFNSWIYFCFFSGKLIPMQVDKSTGVRPEIPIDDEQPPVLSA